MTARPSRRVLLVRAAAAGVVSGIGLASAARDVEAATDPLEEIQRAYPAQQRNGYTYIKMDRVWRSSVLDVAAVRLSHINVSDPQNDRLLS